MTEWPFTREIEEKDSRKKDSAEDSENGPRCLFGCIFVGCMIVGCMIVGGLCSMSHCTFRFGTGSCPTCGPLQFAAPYYGPRSAVVQMSLLDFGTGPVPPMAMSCNQIPNYQIPNYQFPQELSVFSSFDLLLLRLVFVHASPSTFSVILSLVYLFRTLFDACVSQYTTRSKQQKHVDAIPGGTIL